MSRRAFLIGSLVVLFLSLAGSFASSQVTSEVAPQEVTFSSGRLTLHGFIYKPEGNGPFPAVLWNHGSERMPGWLPQLGALFTSKRYVFFAPHRRGQGRSGQAAPYIMDLLNREGAERGHAARSRRLVELMEVHLEDQLAALDYLASFPYVDAKRVAVMGCSFGGIQTVLAAEKGTGLRAAVDFAGAAESWQGSPDIRERMVRAVRHATVPIFFIQADGDYDLTPSRALAKEMKKAGNPHQVVIFPAFGSSKQEAHSFCVRGSEIWAKAVFDFLEAAMPTK